MDTDFRISFLADRQECLPVLAQWLHDEWDHMYPGATLATRTARLEGLLNRDRLPLAVVAHRDGGALGTASLIVCDMATHPELTPWLASVFVGTEFRRQGVGQALVARIMAECRRLGYPRCYLWTDKEEQFYQAMGWTREFCEQYKNQPVSVMSYSFS